MEQVKHVAALRRCSNCSPQLNSSAVSSDPPPIMSLEGRTLRTQRPSGSMNSTRRPSRRHRGCRSWPGHAEARKGGPFPLSHRQRLSACGRRAEAPMAMDAPTMAIWRRGRAEAPSHPSGRGSQYAGDGFQRLLDEPGRAGPATTAAAAKPLATTTSSAAPPSFETGPPQPDGVRGPPSAALKCCPWNRPQARTLRRALRKLVDRTFEIIKRSDTAPGFETLPRRPVAKGAFAWPGRRRKLATDREASAAPAQAWINIAHISLSTRRLARNRHRSRSFERALSPGRSVGTGGRRHRARREAPPG